MILSINFNAFAQFKTTGTIVNRGTIKLKGKALVQEGGNIDNEGGFIEVDAAVTTFTQNNLMGRIDYILGQNGLLQYIPQIEYWDIRFSGNSRKMLSNPDKVLTSLSRFVSTPEAAIYMHDDTHINVLGYVTHNGYFDKSKSNGLVAMIGNTPQDIDGEGTFKELALDNIEGADVINGGGFIINTKLELIKGEMRNHDSIGRIEMSGGSKIVRHVDGNIYGSISNEPVFQGVVSVHYVGTGHLTAGEEIPKNINTLADLRVENSEGITLSKDFTVNRNIHVGAIINTEPVNNNYVLSYTSDNPPTFAGANSEIIGSFRRTKLKYNDERVLYNNRYTYILFSDQTAANSITELTIRVRPKTFPLNSEPETKVERDIYISAKDSAGNDVNRANKMELGYGWRHIASDPNRHETNDLVLSELKLQRYTNSGWEDNASSMPPDVESQDGWAYSKATTVTEFGQFAIGVNAQGQLVLYSKAILEGAFRSGTMSNDLRLRNLIPNKPPDIYPYNMDKYRDTIELDTIDENVVDWVLLEFREDSISSQNRHYKCCLILQDGRIVDTDGSFPIRMAKGEMESGKFFVALHHRNHLAVISKESVVISSDTNRGRIDFTKPENIDISSEIKPLAFDMSNSLLFGLIGGDVNGDGRITEEELQYDTGGEAFMVWENRDIEGYPYDNSITNYRFNRDSSMSGIINTRDYNISWNNRGKKSTVKFSE